LINFSISLSPDLANEINKQGLKFLLLHSPSCAIGLDQILKKKNQSDYYIRVAVRADPA